MNKNELIMKATLDLGGHVSCNYVPLESAYNLTWERMYDVNTDLEIIIQGKKKIYPEMLATFKESSLNEFEKINATIEDIFWNNESVHNMKEPVKTAEVVIAFVANHSDSHWMVFWADPEVAKSFSKFGELIPGSSTNPNKHFLDVDWRYSIEDVCKWMAAYKKPVKTEATSANSRSYTETLAYICREVEDRIGGKVEISASYDAPVYVFFTWRALDRNPSWKIVKSIAEEDLNNEDRVELLIRNIVIEKYVH